VARSGCHRRPARKEASYIMLHVGLDLSRKRVEVCLITDQGELVDELAAPFDKDGLCRALPPAPRASSLEPEEPHPLAADHLRQAVPGL
jgi:hypothetical protein